MDVLSLAVVVGIAIPGGLLSSPAKAEGPLLPPFEEDVVHKLRFPSEQDTLAYVEALRHSDLSQWRSLEEVTARAGSGSCSGAATTSVLTALYLLGLFNLCLTNPQSCCTPPSSARERRDADVAEGPPPLIEKLQRNLVVNFSLDEIEDVPHVVTANGHKIPIQMTVIEEVRKLWDSNPRLLSSLRCSSALESVRSSFISLSGVASGIMLAYSIAQLSRCFPEQKGKAGNTGGRSLPKSDFPNVWFFPISKDEEDPGYLVPSLPALIPVPGEDEPPDGCSRNEVKLEDGRCATLLSSSVCPYHHWVLLNRQTMMGECVPRLCPEGRVYVARDQMCHDVDEASACPGTERLFLTAQGHAVCDCPDGTYMGPKGSCDVLYESAFCEEGRVLQFNKESKSLSCEDDRCHHVNTRLWADDLPFAPKDDGFCYQFNTKGPCEGNKRFGFNVDDLQPDCVSLQEAGLLNPQRSYLYQLMSFPTTPEGDSQHYQVSYVILNGTSWGLEVKSLSKSRRKAREAKEEKRVVFLDTREVPDHAGKLAKLAGEISRFRYGSHDILKSDGRITEILAEVLQNPGFPLEVEEDSITREQRTKSNEETEANEGKFNKHENRNFPEKTVKNVPLLTGDIKSLSFFIEGETMKKQVENSRTKIRNKKVSVANKLKMAALGRYPKSRKLAFQTSPMTSTGNFESLSLNDKPKRSRTIRSTTDSLEKTESDPDGKPKIIHGIDTRPDSQVIGKKKRKIGKETRRGKRNKKERRMRGKRKKRKNKSQESTKRRPKNARKNPRLPERVPALISRPSREGLWKSKKDGEGGSHRDEEAAPKDTVEGYVYESPNRTLFTEVSLVSQKDLEFVARQDLDIPEYLNPRGRRQLGNRGGIIQAPLLSACKPGAKRDFNYKCRTKFIPQDRNRRESSRTGKHYGKSPVLPRIRCPEGTRLDPRGQCQTTSSIFG